MPVPSKHAIMPEPLCYGLYHGSSVERSNHRLFLQRFGELEGVTEFTGPYGWRSIVIQKAVLGQHPEMQEVLRKLDEYPAIDDEDISALEQEEIAEAWDNWAAREFAGLAFDGETQPAKVDLWEVFETARQAAGVEWISEGSGMVVDVAAVAKQWHMNKKARNQDA